MKQVSAIWFSLLFISQGMSPMMDLCCELQKIPNLIDHYFEHKALDGDSFLEFLSEDYLETESDEEKHQDNSESDLPFQGSHHCTHGPIFIPFVEKMTVNEINYKSTLKYRILDISFSSEFLDSPFQPPKA